MPNENPAGVNQPLNQHPLPGVHLYTLARDASLLTDLDVASGLSLLVGPPVKGGIRRVMSSYIQAFIDGSGGNTDTADLEVVYVDKDGKESIVFSTTLPADQLRNIGTNIVLTSEDQGLFVRVTENTAGVLSVVSAWDDVRNVERTDTVLSTSFKDVQPSTPDGLIRFWPTLGEEGGELGAKFLNFDDVVHDFELQITDGSGTMLLYSDTAAPVGEATDININTAVLPPGWSLQARLTTGAGINTVAPAVMIPSSLTNRGPARQNQGGAY